MKNVMRPNLVRDFKFSCISIIIMFAKKKSNLRIEEQIHIFNFLPSPSLSFPPPLFSSFSLPLFWLIHSLTLGEIFYI